MRVLGKRIAREPNQWRKSQKAEGRRGKNGGKGDIHMHAEGRSYLAKASRLKNYPIRKRSIEKDHAAAECHEST